MGIRKIPGGYALKGKTSLIEDVLCELGLQEANPTRVPQTSSENKQADDDKPLGAVEHRTYRRFVGKLLQLAAHRADAQHGVGVLSQALSTPTMRDQRRLKKMARFFAGTKECLLKPSAKDGKAVVQVMVDANWADDASDRKATSGGVLCFSLTVRQCYLVSTSVLRAVFACQRASSMHWVQVQSRLWDSPRCWRNGVNRRSL